MAVVVAVALEPCVSGDHQIHTEDRAHSVWFQLHILSLLLLLLLLLFDQGKHNTQYENNVLVRPIQASRRQRNRYASE